MRAKIALEDGTVLSGKSFGFDSTKAGELVFTTGMTGYIENLTDPSFKGHILMPTYPLQGNYGVDEEWFQSEDVQVEGLIVRENCDKTSYFTSQKTLTELLIEKETPGISNIDTRSLTLKIRDNGAMKCVISSQDIPDEELIEMARKKSKISEIELVNTVSTDNIKTIGEDFNKRVAILDCGIKKAFINEFIKNEIGVVLFPYKSTYKQILDFDVEGLIVSSGPGNPNLLEETVSNTFKLAQDLPVLGIGLGHQIIANAFGAKNYKMSFGHRGDNQPVKNLKTGKIDITSQNHGFSVDKESLEGTDLELSHVNLNDFTVEGLIHNELDVRSTQYYPELSGSSDYKNSVMYNFIEKI